MIINLSKDCFIRAKDNNFEIVQRKVTEKGKPYHKVLGYYGSIGPAAKRSLDFHLMNSDEELSVKELIERVEKVGKQIASACEVAVTAMTAASITDVFDPEELEQLLFFGEDDEKEA